MELGKSPSIEKIGYELIDLSITPNYMAKCTCVPPQTTEIIKITSEMAIHDDA